MELPGGLFLCGAVWQLPSLQDGCGGFCREAPWFSGKFDASSSAFVHFLFANFFGPIFFFCIFFGRNEAETLRVASAALGTIEDWPCSHGCFKMFQRSEIQRQRRHNLRQNSETIEFQESTSFQKTRLLSCSSQMRRCRCRCNLRGGQQLRGVGPAVLRAAGGHHHGHGRRGGLGHRPAAVQGPADEGAVCRVTW